MKRLTNNPIQYLGEHILESLRNRAAGRIVEKTEAAITRKELREIQCERKRKGG